MVAAPVPRVTVIGVGIVGCSLADLASDRHRIRR